MPLPALLFWFEKYSLAGSFHFQNIVAVLIVWLVPLSLSLLPPLSIAVNFRAGKRCQTLTVMEMEALYFSPEQPGEQVRRAAFPALASTDPKRPALGGAASS